MGSGIPTLMLISYVVSLFIIELAARIVT